MAETSAYATPISMPIVTKKPLKKKMTEQAKKHFEDLFSRDVELFRDEKTGELYCRNNVVPNKRKKYVDNVCVLIYTLIKYKMVERR